MKLGLLFAGQGSQHPGMGADFYENCENFRKIFDLLTDEQKEIAFNGPAEKINDTRNTQPVMVAFAAGVLSELMPKLEEKNISIEAAAGLSLGEYSALHCAGVFDAETAVKLVGIRAKAMHDASSGVDCGMKAILGSVYETLKSCCEKAESECAEGKLVRVANLNCPGQIVIAGEKEAVDKATEYALEAGAKRAVPLSVSGPFHTDYMKPAGEVLAEEFEKTQFGDMRIPVVFNAAGRTLCDGESIREMLIRQVSSPVHFEDSIREMEKMGIDTVIEIGPGKALTGFVRKTCRAMKCINIDSLDDLEKAMEIL